MLEAFGHCPQLVCARWYAANRPGAPFCDLQATLDYKTFFERRLQAVGRYLPAAAVMEADFNRRAHITELVNSKKCYSQSEAIHRSWGFGMECWQSASMKYGTGQINRRRTFDDMNSGTRQGQTFSQALAALPDNKKQSLWVQSKNGRELCKRFQVGLCTSPSCRFAHWCAMRECQDLDRHPAKNCPNA